MAWDPTSHSTYHPRFTRCACNNDTATYHPEGWFLKDAFDTEFGIHVYIYVRPQKNAPTLDSTREWRPHPARGGKGEVGTKGAFQVPARFQFADPILVGLKQYLISPSPSPS